MGINIILFGSEIMTQRRPSELLCNKYIFTHRENGCNGIQSVVKFVQILIYAVAILLYLQPYIAHATVFSDST